MNSNQVKGAIKEAAGTVQRKAGELVDSPTQRVKGAAKEVQGKAQKKLGDAQDVVEDASEDLAASKGRAKR